MIVQKNKIPCNVKQTLKTLGDTNMFLFVGRYSYKKSKNKGVVGPNMEDLPNLYIMFFDRYEIHIQAFVAFINGKLIIFNPLLRKI